MNRINQLFDSNPRDLLSIYFCAGYPTLEGTTEVIRTLEKHGVNMIEIGIPVSDPMADGLVISPLKQVKNAYARLMNTPTDSFIWFHRLPPQELNKTLMGKNVLTLKRSKK